MPFIYQNLFQGGWEALDAGLPLKQGTKRINSWERLRTEDIDREKQEERYSETKRKG